MECKAENFSVGGVLCDAWKKVKGSLGSIWAIMVSVIAASWVVHALLRLIFRANDPDVLVFFGTVLFPVITDIIIAPLIAGAIMVGILRARNKKTGGQTGYQYFKRSVPVMIIVAILSLITSLILYFSSMSSFTGSISIILASMIIAALIGLLIISFFVFSVPLAVDKELPALQAICTSFHLAKQNWLKIVGLIIVSYLIFFCMLAPTMLGVFLGATPFVVIGLVVTVLLVIWLGPFLILIHGTLYHKVVDALPEAPKAKLKKTKKVSAVKPKAKAKEKAKPKAKAVKPKEKAKAPAKKAKK